MLMTTRKPFVPNAVFIPTRDGKEGRDFDRTDCTLLFVDGEYSYGEVYTEEAWQNDGEPSYVQRRGDFFLPDDIRDSDWHGCNCCPTPASSRYRTGSIGAKKSRHSRTRIFAVYALDRRQHFHLCEMCASYELGSSNISTSRPKRWTRTTTSGTN